MFKQLIETYNSKNTHAEKETFLQQQFSNLNNLDGSTLTKEIEQQYNGVIEILKCHLKVTMEFLFSKLLLEDCIKFINLSSKEEFQKPGYGLLRAVNDISEASEPQAGREYLQWFSKMYTRHSSYEKVLVFLKLMSQTYLHKIADAFLSEFLADFINASAIAIQAYLKLKSQSPKFDIEYMEHGQTIVNSTEKWVKTFYIDLLQNLRVPNEESPLKKSLLNAVCDIIGALMEIQRQGNILDCICQQILNQSYSYIKKLTNIDEFNNLYVNMLRQRKFNIPHKKILIPEKYPSNEITFSKQSFAYIVFKFLKESSNIYSNAQVIRYLLPVVNQFCPFDYEIKAEVEKMFSKYVSLQWENYETFDLRFPLPILWFNLNHYKNNRNAVYLDTIERIFEKLSKKSPSTYVNSLKLLNEFQTQGFENEKIQMIGEKLLLLQALNINELKILFKAVDLSQLNESAENVWTQAVKRVSKDNDIKSFLSNLIPIKEIKLAFKQNLTKILSNN